MVKQEEGIVTDKNSPDYGRMRASVWSRAMGYIRPISWFNIGKRAEYDERKMFKEKKALKGKKCVNS